MGQAGRERPCLYSVLSVTFWPRYQLGRHLDISTCIQPYYVLLLLLPGEFFFFFFFLLLQKHRYLLETSKKSIVFYLAGTDQKFPAAYHLRYLYSLSSTLGMRKRRGKSIEPRVIPQSYALAVTHLFFQPSDDTQRLSRP